MRYGLAVAAVLWYIGTMSQTPDNTDSSETPTERFEFRVTTADKKLFRLAAAHLDDSISAFARTELRKAARRVIDGAD